MNSKANRLRLPEEALSRAENTWDWPSLGQPGSSSVGHQGDLRWEGIQVGPVLSVKRIQGDSCAPEGISERVRGPDRRGEQLI